MVISLWAIWGARRKAIHKDIFQSPHSVHGFITSYPGQSHVLCTRPPKTPATAVSRASHWLPPEGDSAKINVDVAVSRSGSFGMVGAMCRDKDGVFLGTSAIVSEI